MKHEVFILGQTIDQKARRDGREAREMRKGRREKIEKGSREGIEKETKRQCEEEGPTLLEFLDPTLRCSHCFFKSSGGAQESKFGFYKLIECIIKNVMV